jgi:hypothetical protein
MGSRPRRFPSPTGRRQSGEVFVVVDVRLVSEQELDVGVEAGEVGELLGPRVLELQTPLATRDQELP